MSIARSPSSALARLVLLVLLGLFVLAQGRAVAAAAGSEAAPDDRAEAMAVLERVHAAYRSAPAIVDRVEAEVVSEVTTQRQSMDLAFGRGGASRMSAMGTTITWLDGTLYVERLSVRDKYVAADGAGGARAAMARLFGSDVAPLQFALREAGSMDEVISGFGLGTFRSPELIGTSLTADDRGRPVHRLEFHAGSVRIEADVDSASDLVLTVRASSLEIDPTAPMPDAVTTLRYDPRVLPVLETPIDFEPAGRLAVRSMAMLQPTPLQAGQTMHDWSGPLLSGGTVRAGDLRGSIVVIVFVSTANQRQIEPLPHAGTLHAWALGRNATARTPVRVFACVQGATAEQIRPLVTAGMQAGRAVAPTIIDEPGEVFLPLGIGALPLTIVVDEDGTLLMSLEGGGPEIVETVKETIRARMRD